MCGAEESDNEGRDCQTAVTETKGDEEDEEWPFRKRRKMKGGMEWKWGQRWSEVDPEPEIGIAPERE